MTKIDAVAFLTKAAWKDHLKLCPGNAGGKCNCGADAHNATVKAALITIGKPK